MGRDTNIARLAIMGLIMQFIFMIMFFPSMYQLNMFTSNEDFSSSFSRAMTDQGWLLWVDKYSTNAPAYNPGCDGGGDPLLGTCSTNLQSSQGQNPSYQDQVTGMMSIGPAFWSFIKVMGHTALIEVNIHRFIGDKISEADGIFPIGKTILTLALGLLLYLIQIVVLYNWAKFIFNKFTT